MEVSGGMWNEGDGGGMEGRWERPRAGTESLGKDDLWQVFWSSGLRGSTSSLGWGSARPLLTGCSALLLDASAL